MIRRFTFSGVTASFLILVQLSIMLGSAIAQNATPATASVGTPSATGIFEATVEISGRGLHVACAGIGSPTVLLEPGGPFPDGGTTVVAALGPDLSMAFGTRFCSYDRAGTGQSDPHPMGVRTFQEAAADLQAVMTNPDIGCPCVVVGESLGGGIALVALSGNASNFAGLVLVDANYPGYFDEFLALAPDDSPEAALADDPYSKGENEEQLDVSTGFRQVTTPSEPPDNPVVVVTHGAGYPPPCNWEPPCSEAYPVAEFEAAWQAGQAALATALDGQLIVAEGTGHSIVDENPALVVGLIAEVVAAVRDPSILATPES